MKTLDFIAKKYNLNLTQKSQPIEIPKTTRLSLAEIFAELGFTTGVEVGTEAGIYAEVLCKANPKLKLACVDAWAAYKGYRDHVTQSKLDNIFSIAKDRLAPYDVTFFRDYSMDAVKNFKDNSLDFVYIDANHEYQHVVNDICEWQKKVKVGGIVAGHDYIKRKTNGYLMHVPMAVHGYVESYQIKPWFVLGMKAEPSNQRDRARSWFYVKPEPFQIVAGSGDKIQT